MSIPSQIFPPCPTFTEKDLPDLKGKVYIVTGAAAGIGLELARMLYGKNGTVYIATRSVEKINRAFGNIKASYPNSQGTLQELVLDLANLATIKPAVQKFLAQEQRLDVLFHNAGVMVTPVDAKTVQGHERQLGTNTIGPFLLTRLLEPILVSTAKQSPTGSVRIVWVASIIALGTPKGGVVWDKQLDGPTLLDSPGANYMQSKAGLVFLAHEYSRKLGKEGILSMSLHPGLTKTELQRHMPAPVRALMGVVFKGPEAGALTEIFAGFSPEITRENNGRYIIPWGRFGPLPEHVAAGLKSKDEGVSILMVHWQNIHTPINLDATLPVQVETLFPLRKPDPEPSDPTLTFTSQRRISGTSFPLNSAQQDFKLQSGYSAYSFASRGGMAEQRNESASKAKFTFIPLDQLEKWKMTLKCLYGATVVVSMEEGKYDLDLSIVELPKAKILTEEEIRNKELQEKRAMVVSSQQIIKWFPKWEQYIVATATVTPAGSFGVVHLPFKGKGFLDLVGIAHEAPTTDEESALASLANHLDETRIDQLIFSSVHQLLDPALPKWLSHDLRSLGHARWLEVAYQFGLEDIFQRAACELAFLETISSAQRTLIVTIRMVPWEAIRDIEKCRVEFIRFATKPIYLSLKMAEAHESGNCDKKACPCPQHKNDCLQAQKHNIHGWLKRMNYPQSHGSVEWNQVWGITPLGSTSATMSLENLCDACKSKFSRILEHMKNNRDAELGLFLMQPNCPRLVSNKTLTHLRKRRRMIEKAKRDSSCR